MATLCSSTLAPSSFIQTVNKQKSKRASERPDRKDLQINAVLLHEQGQWTCNEINNIEKENFSLFYWLTDRFYACERTASKRAWTKIRVLLCSCSVKHKNRLEYIVFVIFYGLAHTPNPHSAVWPHLLVPKKCMFMSAGVYVYFPHGAHEVIGMEKVIFRTATIKSKPKNRIWAQYIFILP